MDKHFHPQESSSFPRLDSKQSAVFRELNVKTSSTHRRTARIKHTGHVTPSETDATPVSTITPTKSEEELKKEDVEGREKILHIVEGGLETETSRDKKLEEEEKKLADRSYDLMKSAACINDHIKELREAVKTTAAGSTDALGKPLSKESVQRAEAEMNRVREKLAESKAEEEAVEVVEAQKSAQILPHPESDEMDARTSLHERDMASKEAALKKKSSEVDCETSEALKEFEKETELTSSALSADPEERARALKKREAHVASEGGLAKVEAEAAMDSVAEGKLLLHGAEDYIEAAEKEHDEADHNLETTTTPVTEGDPCEQLKLSADQAVLAEKEAREAETKLNLAKSQLAKAENVANEAQTIATKASAASHEAEEDPCEPKKGDAASASTTADEAQTKSEALETNLKSLRERVSTLSSELQSAELKAQHEAARRLKLEADCAPQHQVVQPEAGTLEELNDGCPPPSTTPSPCYPEVQKREHRVRRVAEADENRDIEQDY